MLEYELRRDEGILIIRPKDSPKAADFQRIAQEIDPYVRATGKLHGVPASIPFVDYSGMSLDNGRVAVVSQVNSMIWVGQFEEPDWKWRDEGRLYEFPRKRDGSIRYGNFEGVGWISPTRVVTVSGRRKKETQPNKTLSEKDQSVHVFEIP